MEKLRAISEIEDIEFVHATGFIGGAVSRQSVVKMAELSLWNCFLFIFVRFIFFLSLDFLYFYVFTFCIHFKMITFVHCSYYVVTFTRWNTIQNKSKNYSTKNFINSKSSKTKLFFAKVNMFFWFLKESQG